MILTLLSHPIIIVPCVYIYKNDCWNRKTYKSLKQKYYSQLTSPCPYSYKGCLWATWKQLRLRFFPYFSAHTTCNALQEPYAKTNNQQLHQPLCLACKGWSLLSVCDNQLWIFLNHFSNKHNFTKNIEVNSLFETIF